MTRGRRLGIDFGVARIGVAVSDPDSILSSPLETLIATSPDLWNRFSEIIDEFSPVEIFIGLPIHLKGQESPSTEGARTFASELQSKFSIPVVFIDERLSTVSAQKKLKEAGVSSKSSKKSIDQMAAVEILNQGLEINGRANRE